MTRKKWIKARNAEELPLRFVIHLTFDGKNAILGLTINL